MTNLTKFKLDDARIRDISTVLSGVTTGEFLKQDHIQRAITMANAIEALREMLNPEVMKPIMALMNSPLGFRTDRDPKQIDQKTGKPHVPYGELVVKDCVIETLIAGFYLVGNEMNIISGRAYFTREAFSRRVREFAGLTDFTMVPGVPVMREKGAIVKMVAKFRLNGEAKVLERDIAVKVNSFMGADAVIGKAERKMLRQVYVFLTGSEHTTDGDTDDIISTTAEVIPEGAASGSRASNVVNRIQRNGTTTTPPPQNGTAPHAPAGANENPPSDDPQQGPDSDEDDHPPRFVGDPEPEPLQAGSSGGAATAVAERPRTAEQNGDGPEPQNGWEACVWAIQAKCKLDLPTAERVCGTFLKNRKVDVQALANTGLDNEATLAALEHINRQTNFKAYGG